MARRSGKRSKKASTIGSVAIIVILALLYIFGGFGGDTPAPAASMDEIPEYNGSPYVVIEDNVPYFDETLLTEESDEEYSNLDYLERCGPAFANIGTDPCPPRNVAT